MLPTRSSDPWTQGIDSPSRFVGTGANDIELYEEDDELVLGIEMPGFDREDLQVNWDQGRLFVAAEHEDENRARRRTYRRTFRMPKEIDADEIEAHYRSGVLEISLPLLGVKTRGQEIEVQ